MDTTIRLRVSGGVPDEDLASMAALLRDELLLLDVDDVRPAAAGPPPEGARADGAMDNAVLTVIAENSRAMLGLVIGTVDAWRRRSDPRPTVRLELDGDVLEISDATADQAQRSFDLFLKRHGSGDGEHP